MRPDCRHTTDLMAAAGSPIPSRRIMAKAPAARSPSPKDRRQRGSTSETDRPTSGNLCSSRSYGMATGARCRVLPPQGSGSTIELKLRAGAPFHHGNELPATPPPSETSPTSKTRSWPIRACAARTRTRSTATPSERPDRDPGQHAVRRISFLGQPRHGSRSGRPSALPLTSWNDSIGPAPEPPAPTTRPHCASERLLSFGGEEKPAFYTAHDFSI